MKKGIAALHPYEGYTLYIVLHKKMQRKMAVLVKTKKDRMTISYARYLLSVHIGRILEKWEQVDHINNDKTDDRVENLQILSVAENNKKSAPKPKIVDLICPVCGKEFSFRAHNLPFKKDPTCSRSCGGKKSARTRIEKLGL